MPFSTTSYSGRLYTSPASVVAAESSSSAGFRGIGDVTGSPFSSMRSLSTSCL
uniref:Uncharacterized protein n=1 Tax=Arundo donax TaxID=35708 RepID=A0A0A8Y8Y5_ARUDO